MDHRHGQLFQHLNQAQNRRTAAVLARGVSRDRTRMVSHTTRLCLAYRENREGFQVRSFDGRELRHGCTREHSVGFEGADDALPYPYAAKALPGSSKFQELVQV